MPTTEIDKTAVAAPPASGKTPASRHFHVRTHYLVNWRSQFMTSLWSIGIVFLMLVLVNVMLFHLGRVSAAGLSPGMAQEFDRADATRRAAVMILSVLFLAGFTVLRMLETHKVAGAAYNLCRRLAKIEAGEYATRVTLRRTDDLQDVAAAVNRVAVSLRDHAWENIRTLEDLNARAERLGGAAGELSAGIQSLLAEQRRRAG